MPAPVRTQRDRDVGCSNQGQRRLGGIRPTATRDFRCGSRTSDFTEGARPISSAAIPGADIRSCTSAPPLWAKSRPSKFVIRARSEDSPRNGYAAAGQHAFSLRRATKSTRAVGDLISHRFFICSILFLRAGCTVSPRNSPVLHAPASRREGWTSFGQCRSMLS